MEHYYRDSVLYMCPVIVRMERRLKHSTFMLAFISFLVYWLGPFIWTKPVYRNKTVYDIFALTPIVWGWMFALGIIAMKYYSSIMRIAKYFPLAVVPVAGIAETNMIRLEKMPIN